MVYKHIDKPTVSLQQKKKDIQCINCGTYGHTSKYCNFPTTSYGIICYKINGIDIDTIKYLMIQRKDTLCYVEFIRGKYEIENKDYIIKLFERMTHHERELIRQNTFEYSAAKTKHKDYLQKAWRRRTVLRRHKPPPQRVRGKKPPIPDVKGDK